MAGPRHFRSREASLWQSAADQVIAQSTAGHALDVNSRAPIEPADPAAPEMAAVNAIAAAIENQTQLPQPDGSMDVRAQGLADVIKFCGSAAFQLARAKAKALLTGDDSDVRKFQEELGAQFGTCDPKWAGVIAEYLNTKCNLGPIPYRRHTNLSDFVIEGPLPDTARVALLGDWGTGDAAAKLLLKQIAEKKPDAVIHLGDVYYSGTEHEFQNYFYKIWQSMFGLPFVNWGSKLNGVSKPATFTMAGNHDMYAGGKPYYTGIDLLGQPASYFCLRNKHWQFIAMDTGLHDADPVSDSITFLEDTEVAWIQDKIQTAGGRQTILLSHHQLFSTFEKIGPPGNRINHNLERQLKNILPAATVWFWGHEHDFVVYPKFMNVLGRCIGHASVPVGVSQVGSADPSVPFEQFRLSADGSGGMFRHGYAILDLKGASADVSYYQYDPESQEEDVIYRETLPAASSTVTAIA